MESQEQIKKQITNLFNIRRQLTTTTNFQYTPEMQEIDEAIENLQSLCEHKINNEYCLDKNKKCIYCSLHIKNEEEE